MEMTTISTTMLPIVLQLPIPSHKFRWGARPRRPRPLGAVGRGARRHQSLTSLGKLLQAVLPRYRNSTSSAGPRYRRSRSSRPTPPPNRRVRQRNAPRRHPFRRLRFLRQLLPRRVRRCRRSFHTRHALNDRRLPLHRKSPIPGGYSPRQRPSRRRSGPSTFPNRQRRRWATMAKVQVRLPLFRCRYARER